jgi:hypothetical protein
MNIRRFICLSAFLLSITDWSYAQKALNSLHYFLPDISYNQSIPTPAQYLGFQIGEWHVSHDQIVGYFKAIDALSDRVEIIEYARSHENRPLFVALISSKKNLTNKELIKKEHAALASGAPAHIVDINKLPAVLWQGYSIHGNEASGSNAALLVAYYLAAGQSNEINDLLENTVILLDPCLNPDGLQRFSTWVNSHKSKNLVSDPAAREFSEIWPGGRYNHYWFDMNRDWLLLVHPESQGRVRLLHEWHPNVVTDHHEMGTNSTFFFQPGIPTSNNPNTPEENFVLTEEIGKYHAKALDSIGSLYFTKANFDDFYYGKGSTYPDAIGAIGILFEQASSRGHLQESVNGPLSFAFTIRNQVVTSISTQKAVKSLRYKLLDYKRQFYKKVVDKINSETVKGYIFTDNDKLKTNLFLKLMLQHHIDVYRPDQHQTINGCIFQKDKSYLVPLAQPNSVLAKTLFERVNSFQDSSFYDVSGWTPSIAYNLTCQPLSSISVNVSQKITTLPLVRGIVSGSTEDIYAYLAAPNQNNLHQFLCSLQQKGVLVKLSQSAIHLNDKGWTGNFAPGTIIVPVKNQNITYDQLYKIITREAETSNIEVFASSTGNSTALVTLGHPSVVPLDQPKVAMAAGSGISPQSAGEIWHHSDINLGLQLTILDNVKFRSTNLNRYNTLLLPEGNYAGWGDTEVNKIKDWCREGNTLITIGTATDWAVDKKLVSLTLRKIENAHTSKSIYENVDREADAKVIAGSIFNTLADITNPLFFGFEAADYPVMKTSNRFYDSTGNKYATPSRYKDDFLLSGFLPKGMEKLIKGAAAITVHGIGNGKVICFQDDPLFRGYWVAGQKVFNNALLYSKILDRRTVESGE